MCTFHEGMSGLWCIFLGKRGKICRWENEIAIESFLFSIIKLIEKRIIAVSHWYCIVVGANLICIENCMAGRVAIFKALYLIFARFASKQDLYQR